MNNLEIKNINIGQIHGYERNARNHPESQIKQIRKSITEFGFNNPILIDELVAAGIPVRVNRRHKIEHNKFAVFDNRRMVTGSYNWTTAATKHNSENCIFLPHPAQEYTKRFEVLWGMYK